MFRENKKVASGGNDSKMQHLKKTVAHSIPQLCDHGKKKFSKEPPNIKEGNYYKNCCGSVFVAFVIKTSNEIVFLRKSDGYLLTAFGTKSILFNGEWCIEWDYSVNIGFPETLEDAIIRCLEKHHVLIYKDLDIISTNTIARDYLDGNYYGIYDEVLGDFID